MSITICKKEKPNLSIIAIDAAEELKKFEIKREDKLKSAKELASLIKEEFYNNFRYQSLFSDAYLSTYNKRIPPMLRGSPKQYHEEISEKLESPYNLSSSELSQLATFCVNLSDFSAANEEYIRKIKEGPCF